jgi:hypothetical protein
VRREREGKKKKSETTALSGSSASLSSRKEKFMTAKVYEQNLGRENLEQKREDQMAKKKTNEPKNK